MKKSELKKLLHIKIKEYYNKGAITEIDEPEDPGPPPPPPPPEPEPDKGFFLTDPSISSVNVPQAGNLYSVPTSGVWKIKQVIGNAQNPSNWEAGNRNEAICPEKSTWSIGFKPPNKKVQ